MVLRLIFILVILLFNINYVNAQSNSRAEEDELKPISIVNRQKIANADNKGEAYINFYIIIERHPDNRSFVLETICETYVSSSFTQLEGENAQKIFDFWSHRLGVGECYLVVTLRRVGGKVLTAREGVQVTS